jgi:hypothetical protein
MDPVSVWLVLGALPAAFLLFVTAIFAVFGWGVLVLVTIGLIVMYGCLSGLNERHEREQAQRAARRLVARVARRQFLPERN